MSKRRGAKGRRQSDIEEDEEMNREMREYEASLPCYMESEAFRW